MSLIVPIVTLWLSFCRITRAQSDYSPCPILGPRYPRPIQISQSEPIQEALSNLTAALDELNISGNGSYTQTTPESTTYSIALFDSSDITQDSPFFYQYHHVAPSYVNTSILDADSIYNIAGLSPLVTVYAALSILDEHQWHDTVTKYLPQLNTVATGSAIQNVNWSDVRLIDLATHLSGLGREATLDNLPETFKQDLAGLLPIAEQQGSADAQSDLVSILQARAPVYQVATTPIYSDAAFQLLAKVLEVAGNESFASIVKSKIFDPLTLNYTTAGAPAPDAPNVISINGNENSLLNANGSESALLAADGIFSSVSDLSRLGKSILGSELLPPVTTNRWLKPHSYTSNLVNGVGMPFDIYTPTLSGDATGAIIPIFTKLGAQGSYSPYFGLVPDYGVGFVILSADTNQAADLNAYADLIGEYLIPALERTAAQEAALSYTGNYTSADGSSTLELLVDGLGGLSITRWTANNGSLDLRSAYAKLKDTPVSSLDMRLYPTNLLDNMGANNDIRLAWRAVLQDIDAPVDAGTPTCITWEDSVDLFVYNGVSLDSFVFEVDTQGSATTVEILALNMTLYRG